MSILQSNESHITINADGASKEVRFQNNGTQNMVLDSSGNVGIGTTSPTDKLSVNDGSSFSFGLNPSANDNFVQLKFETDDNEEKFAIAYGASHGTNPHMLALKSNNGSGSLGFFTVSLERMRINSSGDVGIGTSSPGAKLEIYDADPYIRLTDSVAPTGYCQIMGTYQGALVLSADYSNSVADSHLRFDIDGTEKMRISSSGNVGVATTDTNPAAVSNSVGVSIVNIGKLEASRDGGVSLSLNRKTSDGTIADFRKDGTTVGRLGTLSGLLTIGDDCGVLFNNNNPSITPFNVTTNANRDAAIDLGADNVRFRNAYLSGGVYVGGTGSANYLDDYEEGTWTPDVMSDTSVSDATTDYIEGVYTKIGRLVTCHIRWDFASNGTDTGAVGLSLPFGVADILTTTAVQGGASLSWVAESGTSGILYAAPWEGTSVVRFGYASSWNGASVTQLPLSTVGDNFQGRMTVTYLTS